eukprot:UN08466
MPYLIIEGYKNYSPSYIIAKLLVKNLYTLFKSIFQNNNTTQQGNNNAPINNNNFIIKYYKLYLFDRQQNPALLLSQFVQNIQYISLINDYGYKHGKCLLPSDKPLPQNQLIGPQPAEGVPIDNNDAFWYFNRFKILPSISETVHHTSLQYKNEIQRVQQL